MTSITRLWLFVAASAWLAVLPGLVGCLLARWSLLRPNYRGERIPVGYGLVIVLWSVPVLAALFYLLPSMRHEIAACLSVVVGLGALGFADDLWGDRRASGLRGHLRKFLFEGEVTTGFVKAAGGLSLAVLVSRLVLARTWPEALLDGPVIALSANALNLLDLRPGRAGAIFLLAAAVLLTVHYIEGGEQLVPTLAFVVIPALLVYERDARARVMLGDTGSNPLGGALGLAVVLWFPSPVRLVVLAFLVLLHLAAERWSLSRLIERHPLLRRLDALTGRR